MIPVTDLELEVPYLPDPDYHRLIEAHHRRLAAVNFCFDAPTLADGRCAGRRPPLDALLEGLGRLKAPAGYLLLNARIHDPALYGPGPALAALRDRVRQLADAGVLDGIVWADAYLLQALGDAAPDLAARLEAVPSVNCTPDRFERIAALMDMVAAAGFRPPAKLVLDRSLNRRPGALAEVVKRCQTHYPSMKLGLLANEGCLPDCPFKPAHDAQIATTHLGLAVDTFRLNRDLGCLRQLNAQPWRLYRSPFIRPEDLSTLAGGIDFIKICGRTLGPVFLRQTVTAYLTGRHDGNLLDLLDSPNDLARRIYIDNRRLPADFAARLAACPPVCSDCDRCARLHAECARHLPLHLPTLIDRHQKP